MSEEWTIDDCGFITNGIHFFHYRDVKGLSKIDREEMTIFFPLRAFTLKWPNTDDRDKIFDWFIEVLKVTAKQGIENYKLQQKMQAASLEIQNKIAGHVTK